MARYLEAFSRVGDLGPIDAQDREVLVEVIADIKIPPVGSEHRRLWQPADLDTLLDLSDFLAIDLQDREAAVLIVEKGLLVRVRAAQDYSHSHIALRADSKPLRPVADRNLVNDARWLCFEIDHTDRIDLAVGSA